MMSCDIASCKSQPWLWSSSIRLSAIPNLLDLRPLYCTEIGFFPGSNSTHWVASKYSTFKYLINTIYLSRAPNGSLWRRKLPVSRTFLCVLFIENAISAYWKGLVLGPSLEGELHQFGKPVCRTLLCLRACVSSSCLGCYHCLLQRVVTWLFIWRGITLIWRRNTLRNLEL